MTASLARAVHHAHQRGALHRDLKPGNVLSDSAGEPSLIDFGLAKLIDLDSAMTLSQSMLGTPQYMSPEQAAGEARDLTTASEVWSSGAILYQLVTKRKARRKLCVASRSSNHRHQAGLAVPSIRIWRRSASVVWKRIQLGA